MESTSQMQSAHKWNGDLQNHLEHQWEYEPALGTSLLEDPKQFASLPPREPVELSHRFGLPYPVPGIPPHSLTQLITGDVAEAARGLGDKRSGFRVPGEEIYDSALPHLDHWAASPDPWQHKRYERRIVFPPHRTRTSWPHAHEEHLPSRNWPHHATKKYPEIDVPVKRPPNISARPHLPSVNLRKKYPDISVPVKRNPAYGGGGPENVYPDINVPVRGLRIQDSKYPDIRSPVRLQSEAEYEGYRQPGDRKIAHENKYPDITSPVRLKSEADYEGYRHPGDRKIAHENKYPDITSPLRLQAEAEYQGYRAPRDRKIAHENKYPDLTSPLRLQAEAEYQGYGHPRDRSTQKTSYEDKYPQVPSYPVRAGPVQDKYNVEHYDIAVSDNYSEFPRSSGKPIGPDNIQKVVKFPTQKEPTMRPKLNDFAFNSEHKKYPSIGAHEIQAIQNDGPWTEQTSFDGQNFGQPLVSHRQPVKKTTGGASPPVGDTVFLEDGRPGNNEYAGLPLAPAGLHQHTPSANQGAPFDVRFKEDIAQEPQNYLENPPFYEAESNYNNVVGGTRPDDEFESYEYFANKKYNTAVTNTAGGIPKETNSFTGNIESQLEYQTNKMEGSTRDPIGLHPQHPDIHAGTAEQSLSLPDKYQVKNEENQIENIIGVDERDSWPKMYHVRKKENKLENKNTIGLLPYSNVVDDKPSGLEKYHRKQETNIKDEMESKPKIYDINDRRLGPDDYLVTDKDNRIEKVVKLDPQEPYPFDFDEGRHWSHKNHFEHMDNRIEGTFERRPQETNTYSDFVTTRSVHGSEEYDFGRNYSSAIFGISGLEEQNQHIYDNSVEDKPQILEKPYARGKGDRQRPREPDDYAIDIAENSVLWMKMGNDIHDNEKGDMDYIGSTDYWQDESSDYGGGLESTSTHNIQYEDIEDDIFKSPPIVSDPQLDDFEPHPSLGGHREGTKFYRWPPSFEEFGPSPVIDSSVNNSNEHPLKEVAEQGAGRPTTYMVTSVRKSVSLGQPFVPSVKVAKMFVNVISNVIKTIPSVMNRFCQDHWEPMHQP